jgi:hypothetical protein
MHQPERNGLIVTFQYKPDDWRTCSKVSAKLLKASSPLRMSLKSFKDLPQDQKDYTSISH